MTEPENFLQRWSQRKLAKGDEASEREPPTQDDNKNEKAAAITSATRVSHDRAGKLFAAMVAAQARQRR
jgi:hypothetical protein